MSTDKEEKEQDKNVERLSWKLPWSHLEISGKSVSKLWWFVGWSILLTTTILSLSNLIKNVLESFK